MLVLLLYGLAVVKICGLLIQYSYLHKINQNKILQLGGIPPRHQHLWCFIIHVPYTQ